MKSFFEFYQDMLKEQGVQAPTAPIAGQQATGTAPAVPPMDPNTQRIAQNLKQIEPMLKNMKNNPNAQKAFQDLSAALQGTQQPNKPGMQQPKPATQLPMANAQNAQPQAQPQAQMQPQAGQPQR